MAFNKEGENKVIEQHEWERTWVREDYIRHTSELTSLKVSFDDCVKDWDEGTKKGALKHPHFIFQLRHGGMSPDGSVIHRPSDRHQRYDINTWKLGKLERWIYLNQNESEALNGIERSDVIMSNINQMFDKSKRRE